MAVTVLPSWGDKVGAGLAAMGENYAAGRLKQKEMEADAKKKDPIDIFKEMAAVMAAKQAGFTDEQIKAAGLNDFMSYVEPKALEQMQQGGFIAPPVSTPMPMQGSIGQGIPSMSLQDAIMKKQFGFESPAMAQRDLAIKQAEISSSEATKKKQDIEQSKQVSTYNYGLVAGNMLDLSDRLSKAYTEGGAGDRVKSTLSSLYSEGLIPEVAQKKFGLEFPETSAVYGKRVEILSKMFPMLTQQIGKEGSVRLIESIFTRLGKTIPDTFTPPAAAITQMEASEESMFRILKAFNDIDINSFDMKSQSGQKEFLDKITDMASSIELTPEEKEVLTKTQQQTTKPIREYLNKNKTNLKKKYNLK